MYGKTSGHRVGIKRAYAYGIGLSINRTVFSLVERAADVRLCDQAVGVLLSSAVLGTAHTRPGVVSQRLWAGCFWLTPGAAALGPPHLLHERGQSLEAIPLPQATACLPPGLGGDDMFIQKQRADGSLHLALAHTVPGP